MSGFTYQFNPMTLANTVKAPRKPTEAEELHFESMMRSAKVLTVFLQGQLFLFGLEVLDYICEHDKEMYNRWGAKSERKLESRKRQWWRSVRVEQEFSKSLQNSEFFLAKHFYGNTDMRMIKEKLWFALHTAIGRIAKPKDMDLTIRAVMYRGFAEVVTMSFKGMLQECIDYANSINPSPEGALEKILKPTFTPLLIVHPDYMAEDIAHRFVAPATLKKILDDYQVKQALSAYRGAWENSIKWEDMIQAMEACGDTMNAEAARAELEQETKDMTDRMLKRLVAKFNT